MEIPTFATARLPAILNAGIEIRRPTGNSFRLFPAGRPELRDRIYRGAGLPPPLSRLRQFNNLAARSAVHRRSHVSAQGIIRRLHRIVGKVSTACRCLSLGMTQQLADDNQALSARCGHACERVSQVMKPHVIEFCGFADTAPGLLDVDKVTPRLLPADYIGVSLKSGDSLQQSHRGRAFRRLRQPAMSLRQPQAPASPFPRHPGKPRLAGWPAKQGPPDNRIAKLTATHEK